MKNEAKMEGSKREDYYALAKGEGTKGEVKGETKGEMKGETKGEMKGEGVKGESKRERLGILGILCVSFFLGTKQCAARSRSKKKKKVRMPCMSMHLLIWQRFRFIQTDAGQSEEGES